MIEWNPQVTPHHVALVCHPHPLYGGTMHNKVVYRAAKAALQLGLPTLRFNFRGAGKSVGTFTGGDGEREDVRAALGYLASHYPGLPVCLMGFSFGAWVGLAVGSADPQVIALVGLGVPVNTLDFGFLREVRKPKLILQGTRDEFGSVVQVSDFYDSLAEPKQLHWVQAADHFFAGKLDEVQEVVQHFLSPIIRELTAL
ncbi:MAG TPA: alpha/beta family hydrolase [Terriglobia bacterium]|nr:alpha/beta family hydrolase [Terriglobia bacterium]